MTSRINFNLNAVFLSTKGIWLQDIKVRNKVLLHLVYPETFWGFPLGHRSILMKALPGNQIILHARQASTISIQLSTVHSKIPTLQKTLKPEVCHFCLPAQVQNRVCLDYLLKVSRSLNCSRGQTDWVSAQHQA